MYLIANWKENKTAKDIITWFHNFNFDLLLRSKTTKVIICPSEILIDDIREQINTKEYLKQQVFIGAQNVSAYKSGKHTGETSATQLKDQVSYCIVGHSERRSELNETNEDVNRKVENLLNVNITPIICFRNIKEFNVIPKKSVKKSLLAYEPPNMIGGTKTEDINKVEKLVKETNLTKIIYGGGVNKTSLKDYVKARFIEGLLVGTASLSAKDFSDILFEVVEHNP